jgi:uncharacterized Zn-binding protein involved in type VI secretion
MHVCPKVEPGPVPHVGGPTSSGEPTVIIGFMAAARVGDSLVCFGGPPDSISQGEATVLIGNKPAARLGDPTSHGGVIVAGCPTVIIGSSGQAQTIQIAARNGTPFCEECEKKAAAAAAASAANQGKPAEEKAEDAAQGADSEASPPASAESAVEVNGPYSHLEDPPGVGPGQDFTAAQKTQVIEENMKRNGGVVRSDLSGKELVKPAKSKKGVTPDPDEWQLDHIVSKAKGGTNSYKNAQVLSRQENRDKWHT